MHREKLIHFFKDTGLVTLNGAEEIAACFEEKEISKNEFFLKEGRIANEYFFLESGYMRSFAHDTNGNDVTTNFYTTGQVVFEVSSFFNRTNSRENIQAITDCNGWYLTYQQLNILFHQLPEFRDFGRHILVKGFAALKTRVLSMITETAEQRYEKLLAANADIFLHASLKTIASYIGITDTSLSRIRREFTKK